MSVEKLYKKLKANLKNARIENLVHRDALDQDLKEDMLLKGEIETLERIVDWKEFNEFR
tara:strand:- start:161 stop:337 length:177 start_codon:yes stop_codon:yes gene_type:complete